MLTVAFHMMAACHVGGSAEVITTALACLLVLGAESRWWLCSRCFLGVSSSTQHPLDETVLLFDSIFHGHGVKTDF